MAAVDDVKNAWVLRVLGVTVGVTAGGAEGKAEGEGGARYSPVAIGKAALGWRKLCADSSGDLAKLKQAIIAAYSGDEWDEDETAVVISRVEQLDAVLAGLDADLADTVDDFLNTPQGPDKDKAMRAVLAEIDDYERMLSSDALLAEVDSNELLSTGLKSRAMAALDTLRKGFVPIV